jgi:hypothetical protein
MTLPGIEPGASHLVVCCLKQLHILPLVYPSGRILSEIYTFFKLTV